MEQLNEELDKLIDKLEHSANFRNDLDNVKSVYPLVGMNILYQLSYQRYFVL